MLFRSHFPQQTREIYCLMWTKNKNLKTGRDTALHQTNGGGGRIGKSETQSHKPTHEGATHNQEGAQNFELPTEE